MPSAAHNIDTTEMETVSQIANRLELELVRPIDFTYHLEYTCLMNLSLQFAGFSFFAYDIVELKFLLALQNLHYPLQKWVTPTRGGLATRAFGQCPVGR